MTRTVGQDAEEVYEAPALSEIGSVHDLTLKRRKYTSKNSDFSYPTRFSFSFKP